MDACPANERWVQIVQSVRVEGSEALNILQRAIACRSLSAGSHVRNRGVVEWASNTSREKSARAGQGAEWPQPGQDAAPA